MYTAKRNFSEQYVYTKKGERRWTTYTKKGSFGEQNIYYKKYLSWAIYIL